MGKGNRNKGSKHSSGEIPARPASGGATSGSAGYAASSGGKLKSFFKRGFLLTFALLFIVLMVAALWFLYRARLVTAVALAVVVLTLALGAAFWLVSLVRKRPDDPVEDAQPFNETHDRRDYPERPQEEFGSLITQTQPSQVSRGSSGNTPSADLIILKDAYKALAKKVNEIDARLTEFERERYYSTNSKTMREGEHRAEALAPPPPTRLTPPYDSYQESRAHPAPIDLSALNQAVCRFLAQESGSWEIEQLVRSVQRSSDGNTPIEVQHLGSYSSGEWRLVALWPQRSQEGLVLVSSGELVDDDIAKYFEVSFGRRIIACKQPARVSRGGSEVTVLQKGRVESS